VILTLTLIFAPLEVRFRRPDDRARAPHVAATGSRVREPSSVRAGPLDQASQPRARVSVAMARPVPEVMTV
jgi:hypothetical protein